MEGPDVQAFILVTQTCSRVLSPQGPRAAQGNERHSSKRRCRPSRVRSTCPLGRGPGWMNPWDQSDGEGRGDISELPGGFPAEAPQLPGRARTDTYPSCQGGRTHSTPGPAPRTRSQLAAAASLASCELCAAGATRGGPSWSAWAPSLGEDGELRRPEC